MKNDEMKKFVESIQNKLGKENSSIIADDLGTLLSDNITMNKTIEEKDNTIKEKENAVMMKNENYKVWKNVYETTYNTKLTYTTDPEILKKLGIPSEE